MEPAIRIVAGGAASVAVAAAACRLRALTRSGAWAAALYGTVLAAAGGWSWLALAGVFFASSSALTRIEPAVRPRPRRSEDLGGRRWDQVVANGAVAALAACVHAAGGQPLAFVAGAGAFATATADTWATEVGRFSASRPVLITNGTRVPHGTSGGVTVAGSTAACAGAALIAWIAAALSRENPWESAAAIALGGIAGALLDSVLGATIEARCRWVGNGTVNLAATACGAFVAMALARR